MRQFYRKLEGQFAPLVPPPREARGRETAEGGGGGGRLRDAGRHTLVRFGILNFPCRKTRIRLSPSQGFLRLS